MQINSINSFRPSFQGVWHLTSPKPHVYVDTYHPYKGEKTKVSDLKGRHGVHCDGYEFTDADGTHARDTEGLFKTVIGEAVEKDSVPTVNTPKGQEYPYPSFVHKHTTKCDVHSPKEIYLTEKQYEAVLKSWDPYRYNSHLVDDNYDGNGCGPSCLADSIADSEY
ncbi:hypothetical protein II906_04310 [bacterium]|nr:hypothetical protein [bacterium]